MEDLPESTCNDNDDEPVAEIVPEHHQAVLAEIQMLERQCEMRRQLLATVVGQSNNNDDDDNDQQDQDDDEGIYAMIIAARPSSSLMGIEVIEAMRVQRLLFGHQYCCAFGAKSAFALVFATAALVCFAWVSWRCSSVLQVLNDDLRTTSIDGQDVVRAPPLPHVSFCFSTLWLSEWILEHPEYYTPDPPTTTTQPLTLPQKRTLVLLSYIILLIGLAICCLCAKLCYAAASWLPSRRILLASMMASASSASLVITVLHWVSWKYCRQPGAILELWGCVAGGLGGTLGYVSATCWFLMVLPLGLHLPHASRPTSSSFS